MNEHYCDCCGHTHGDLEAYEKIAELEAKNKKLTCLRGNLLWLGNNIHNYGGVAFKGYLEAAIEDALESQQSEPEPKWIEIEKRLNMLYCVYHRETSANQEVQVALDALMDAYDKWID